MKKIISLILVVVLIACSLPIAIISMAADGNTDFTVNSSKVASTTITGDATKGYTMSVGGYQTRIMTKDKYPISDLSFDFGFNYSMYAANQGYGEFGISKINDVDALTGKSSSNGLTFFYYVNTDNKGTSINIYVRWTDGTSALIGTFPFATYRPADGYWSPNVSNFSFVKVGAHWHLAVDGNVCNNVASKFDYSCLEIVLGSEIFENNEEVYIYVGAYDNANVGGKIYFKQLSDLSEDGLWESRAVDSYKYTYNGTVYEYRGQGNTAQTVHSAIPAAATGTKDDGHIVDFTGTDGYAQTTVGLNLKTAKFHVTPKTTATVNNSTNNVFNYYIGFTSDPSDLQYHSVKPGDSVEFHAWSVNSDGTTYGKVITNKGCLATPSEEWGAGQRLCYYRTLNTEGFTIDFVRDTGADGQLHWYMRTSIGGESIVAKGTASNDAYFQFDNIIDKPVYFRMGTHGMTTTNFTMSCKIDSWPIDDETLTNQEKEKIEEIEERIAAIGEVTEENYKTIEEELKSIREEYDALSAVAQAYIPIVKLEQKEKEVASIKELVECGDWYVANSTTTYTGDKWINYTFANSLSSGQNLLATTSANYDITKNSLYWKGINIPGGSWFLFGLTQDMRLGMFPGKNDNGIHFILRPQNNAIQVSFWNPTNNTEDPIGDSSQRMYNEFEYYNTSKSHYFTMVKQEDGHWYLKIDDKVFDGEYFDVIDNYMEQYGEATKVRFGAYGGLGQCEVNIIDPTIDDSIVPDEIADEVKAFDDKVNALGGISAITEDNYSTMRDKVDELLAEYETLHSRVKKYVTTKDLLDAMNERLNLMKQAESLGDWKTSLEEFTYIKNDDGSYDFSSAMNKGFAYAITTTPYDFTKNGLEWGNIYTPPGVWFTFGLTADYSKYSMNDSSKKSIVFIITPSNNDVYVRYWDPDSRKEVNLLKLMSSKYTGFGYYDRSKTHSFGFTKGNDGHWYLYIDNMIFNDYPIEAIDNFMETYGESAYVMFGGWNGLDVCTVNIKEMEYSDGSVNNDATDVKGVLTEAQKYLQLLEDNHVAIWEYNASVTAKLFKAWNALDYRAQLEVESVLMDDDYMWEIYDLVVTYAPELYVADISSSNKNDSNSNSSGEVQIIPDSSEDVDTNSDSSDTNNLNSGSSNTKKPNTNSSNKKDSNSNLIKILILGSVLIIVLAVFLIIGYKVYKKSKKTN